MKFVVGKTKGLLVHINQLSSSDEPKAKTITVTSLNTDTILLKTDSLDDVVDFVNEFNAHTYNDLTHFEKCLFDIKDQIPKEWKDVSYGNDTCPSFEFKGYQIFIDNEDPSERENGDGKRFHIIDTEEYGYGKKPLLETDDFLQVLKYFQ